MSFGYQHETFENLEGLCKSLIAMRTKATGRPNKILKERTASDFIRDMGFKLVNMDFFLLFGGNYIKTV